jgi:hypothetical protein
MYTASTGGASSLSLEWLSTYGPSVIINDFSISTAIPAVIRTVPPRNSLASFWSLTASNESDTIMNLNAPAGTCVDVWFTIVFNDGVAARSVPTAISGTQGLVYATYLDGPRTGAVFGPVGLVGLN